MGQDHMLGGQPGPNYCILACEQWNSPLYCDSEHMQDKEVGGRGGGGGWLGVCFGGWVVFVCDRVGRVAGQGRAVQEAAGGGVCGGLFRGGGGGWESEG